MTDHLGGQKTAERPNLSPARRWFALGALCLGALVISVDLTVLQLAIPSVTEDLSPTSTEILWIADIYGLVMASMLITMGIVGDRIGHKKLMLIGAFTFAGASALATWSPNAELLIASRALLGVSGATIYPTTLSIIRNVFTDPKERTAAIGIWTGMISGGTALGPVIGGPLLDNFWWGSVFLINLPLMGLLIVTGIILLPESRNPNAARPDIPSMVLCALGIVAVVYAVQESVRDGFTEPKILAALAIGIVALALFGFRQTRLNQPMVELKLFRNRAFSGAFIANAFTMFASVGVLLLVSQYLQFVQDWSPLKAALGLLPPAGAGMLCAPLIGALIPRWGQARVVALGLGLLSLAMVLYSRAGADSDYVTVLIPTIVHGAAASCIFACTVNIIVNSAPKEKSGTASGLATTGGELGAAMGMAVLGTILNSLYHKNFDTPSGLTKEQAEQAGDSIGSAMQVAAQSPGQVAEQITESAKAAYADGMQAAVLVNAGVLAAICLLTLITLRGLPRVFTDEPAEETGAQPAQGAELPTARLTPDESRAR
ncbi:DHA2 family efflux MFS transporter permease subunit [Streptomyces sp. NPDC050658]|uniref:DHA2 family efflux MFS transporter permease subunit n=1 Tax=unclassified Streptomyces TaxID=2593676 RepID=UPI0034130850